MIRALIDGFRRLRRRLSRNETMVRWLRLSQCDGAANEPGLVMIQVDGLAFNQLTRALRKRRMPFLRKLIRKRGYQLHTMYSGLPSSTPAVQAEIFYGIRCAVPAWSRAAPLPGPTRTGSRPHAPCRRSRCRRRR